VRDLDELDLNEHCVVQRYINKPVLMEKMKFDLRLYVLVLGVDPLRIYLSREGLARLSTKLYDEVNESNVDDMMMHLTNYAVNKNSNNFQPNQEAKFDAIGHKRSLNFTLRYLKRCVSVDPEAIMTQIKDIVVKTLIAAQPHVNDAFKSCQPEDFENSMCFEILGFDIMFDEKKCTPQLLEVNHSPSFSTDSPIDEKVKGDIIRDTMRMLALSKRRKQTYRKNLQLYNEQRVASGKWPKAPAHLKE
jgi:tubulin polyglutamylase TTLL6/13